MERAAVAKLTPVSNRKTSPRSASTARALMRKTTTALPLRTPMPISSFFKYWEREVSTRARWSDCRCFDLPGIGDPSTFSGSPRGNPCDSSRRYGRWGGSITRESSWGWSAASAVCLSCRAGRAWLAPTHRPDQRSPSGPDAFAKATAVPGVPSWASSATCTTAGCTRMRRLLWPRLPDTVPRTATNVDAACTLRNE